jgi:hypothetical protein
MSWTNDFNLAIVPTQPELPFKQKATTPCVIASFIFLLFL